MGHSWIDAPASRQTGHSTTGEALLAHRGLYFLGPPWLHTRGSALLGWVRDDARHIAGFRRPV